MMLAGPEEAEASAKPQGRYPTASSGGGRIAKVRPAELLDLMGVEIEGFDTVETPDGDEE